MSGQTALTLEARVAELEQHVQRLEHLVNDLLSKRESPKSWRVAPVQERTTGSLPRKLVSLTSFVQFHSVAEDTVLTHVDMKLLPAKHGVWTDRDGMVVTLTLDTKGRATFHQLYPGIPPFVSCKLCPH